MGQQWVGIMGANARSMCKERPWAYAKIRDRKWCVELGLQQCDACGMESFYSSVRPPLGAAPLLPQQCPAQCSRTVCQGRDLSSGTDARHGQAGVSICMQVQHPHAAPARGWGIRTSAIPNGEPGPHTKKCAGIGKPTCAWPSRIGVYMCSAPAWRPLTMAEYRPE